MVAQKVYFDQVFDTRRFKYFSGTKQVNVSIWDFFYSGDVKWGLLSRQNFENFVMVRLTTGAHVLALQAHAAKTSKYE